MCGACRRSCGSSLISQQHEPAFALTDINHVVDRVLVLTTHLFAPNRIVLEAGFGQGLPNVMVDRHMIEQVLMNLVLNAVQAMKDGGVFYYPNVCGRRNLFD